ncbi:MAG: D-glycerate dehydrogenase [Nitrospiraceae bacterium]
MSRPRLFLTRRLPDLVMDEIARRFELTQPPSDEPLSRDALLDGVHTADAMLCLLSDRIDDTILAAGPSLKIVANYAVGYNNIDRAAAARRNIVVTNTPDVLTDATADIAWALLFAVARHVPTGHTLVQSGQWTGWAPRQLLGGDIAGQTLGIVGMGRIGRAVAERASGFRMPVLYHAARPPKVPVDPAWRAAPLDELLATADFISLHVPLTPETQHLIDTRAFSRMRSTAYLINTARGPVVDEAALVEALRSHRIAGAGLDVYEQEPALHPGLASSPNVVLLPHLGSATHRTRMQMGFMCLENIDAVLTGRPAPHRVA